MERVHLYTVQKLQLELADARENGGTFTEESRISQENSKDVSQYGQNDGNHLEVNGNGTSGGSTGTLPNGNSDNVTSFGSGNPSTQVLYYYYLGFLFLQVVYIVRTKDKLCISFTFLFIVRLTTLLVLLFLHHPCLGCLPSFHPHN